MNKSLYAGLLMLVLGVVFLLVLIPQGIVEPKKVKYAALSPSYYPRFVAIALIALGLAVSVRSLLPRRVGDAAIEQTAHPNAIVRTVIVFGILAIYATVIPYLGFIVASTLVLITMLWLAGERRWYCLLPIAVLLPVLLYFFFLKVANVPIPLGILSPWLEGV